MIEISNKKLVYISCAVLITLVCFYLLLVWQIKQIIEDELGKKMEEIEKIKSKNKKKKLLYLKQKRNSLLNKKHDNQSQSANTADQFTEDMEMDSYIDPAEGYVNESNIEYQNEPNSRLDKNDIMTRDIADRIR